MTECTNNEPKKEIATIPVLVVDQWDERFENAKSRSVNQKTYGQYPLKQGLGYCHLMLNRNGSSIFGTFMALVNIIHTKPAETRKGYLTTTGDETGYPLSFNDMAMLTRIPIGIVKDAMKVLTQHPVEWINLQQMEIPCGYLEDTAITAEYDCIVCTVSSVRTKARKHNEPDADFDKFWEAYPKKKKKIDAQKAWGQMKPVMPDIEKIVAKLQELRSTKDWQKEDGQYVPLPASWLRAGGWDDQAKVDIFTAKKPETYSTYIRDTDKPPRLVTFPTEADATRELTAQGYSFTGAEWRPSHIWTEA